MATSPIAAPRRRDGPARRGILIQSPIVLPLVRDFDLPPAGYYGTGIAFLPQDPHEARQAMAQVEKIVKSEELEVIGWREVPIEPSVLGKGSSTTMPNFAQLFVSGDNLSGLALDRRLYAVRKRIEHEIHLKAGVDESNEAMGGMSTAHDGVYFPSLSARTMVYKGMLTTRQLQPFFPDLTDTRSSRHTLGKRFSTNTFPTGRSRIRIDHRHNGRSTGSQPQRMSRARIAARADLIPGDPRDCSRLQPVEATR